MSKQTETVGIEDKTIHDKEVLPENLKQLHYRLVTENCMSHTWFKPFFKVIASNHHNGERFYNETPRPEGRSRWGLLKWFGTRK